MTASAVLVDAFGRVRDAVHGAVENLTDDELIYRPDDHANSIAWLVWHLSRVEDDHVCAAAKIDQVWMSQDWEERFALPFDPAATGYGQDSEEVAQVVCDGSLLLGYQDAVHERVISYVAMLGDEDLNLIVDRRWSPPVTLGVRLVSVIADGLEHAGQAAYIRGLALRRRTAG
jgi:hypothetical protein